MQLVATAELPGNPGDSTWTLSHLGVVPRHRLSVPGRAFSRRLSTGPRPGMLSAILIRSGRLPGISTPSASSYYWTKRRIQVAERDILVNALVAEVLGPRHGAWEQLAPDEDPLEEYITGVLAPTDATDIDLDAEDEPVAEEDPEADDQSDPGLPSATLGLTVPALDPRSRPASLGISFSLRSAETPRIDVCCTWARYEEAQGWRRSPRTARWDAVQCGAGDQTFTPQSDAQVQVIVRTRPQGDAWRVSVFLV